jgi:prepilin-type N-terminal cleavage/methylation domain-containing protein
LTNDVLASVYGEFRRKVFGRYQKMVSKNVTSDENSVKMTNEVNMANCTNEKGFSLIELLLVVVIIGIISAMAVPAYQKATRAAENASMKTMLRIMYSTEAQYYTQHGRFGRLEEIHPSLNNSGTLIVDKIVRGRHTYEMLPVTDEELRTQFTIIATGNISDSLLESLEVTQDGVIQVYP